LPSTSNPFNPSKSCAKDVFLQVKVERRKVQRRKVPRRKVHLRKGKLKNGKKTIVKKK
jgi:hypothetical protein